MGAAVTTHEHTPVGRFSSLAVSETIPITRTRGAGFLVSLALSVDAAKLVAPVEIPDVMPLPEESFDLGLGIEGGVPGGVEGGVPGGVVGGIVGGLPTAPPPRRPKVVRVGGNIIAPERIRGVSPEYPALAREARVEGIVILEARVNTRGRVVDVKVLRGHPLLDEPALVAVRQWRYRPLLLNGEPTEFILTVTVNFRFKT